MFVASIDIELGVLGFAEAGFGKHAVDSALDEEDRAAFADDAWRFDFLTADVAGEAGIDFGVFLVAGEDDLIRIDDDDKIAGIHVGGEDGLVLTAKKACRFDGDLAEDFAFGINDVPLALDFVRFGGKCVHVRDGERDSATRKVCGRRRKLGSGSGRVN